VTPSRPTCLEEVAAALLVPAALVSGAIFLVTPVVAQESGYQIIRGTRVFTQINHAAGVATFSNDCGSQTLTQGQLQAGAYPDQIIPCPKPSPSPPPPSPPPQSRPSQSTPPMKLPGDAEGYRRAVEKEQQCNRLANVGNYLAAAACYSQAAQMYVGTTDTTADVQRMNQLAAQMRSKIASSLPTDRPSDPSRPDRGSCSQPAISYITVRPGSQKSDCIGAGCYVFENSCPASAIKVFYQASDGFGSDCSVLRSRNITTPRGSPGSPGTSIDFSCSVPQISGAQFSK
jgi:hypothetical protein